MSTTGRPSPQSFRKSFTPVRVFSMSAFDPRGGLLANGLVSANRVPRRAGCEARDCGRVKDRHWQRHPLFESNRMNRLRATMPEWLEPMAATLTSDRFSDPNWTFERKLDGIRLLAYKSGDSVQLWSRNRLSLTASYPAVARAISALPVAEAIFDGEATGAWGRQGSADYHVFDVLWL